MSGRRLQVRHLPRPARPLGEDTSRRERFDTRANRLPYVAKPTPGWPASPRSGQGDGLDTQKLAARRSNCLQAKGTAPVGLPPGPAGQAPCSAPDRKQPIRVLIGHAPVFGRSPLLNRYGRSGHGAPPFPDGVSTVSCTIGKGTGRLSRQRRRQLAER
jgi:hypothetical protein